MNVFRVVDCIVSTRCDDDCIFLPMKGCVCDNRVALRRNQSGEYRGGETHVPISNTLFKPSTADGSATPLWCESRLSPVLWPGFSKEKPGLFGSKNQKSGKDPFHSSKKER